jgi:hypothetical protein
MKLLICVYSYGFRDNSFSFILDKVRLTLFGSTESFLLIMAEQIAFFLFFFLLIFFFFFFSSSLFIFVLVF